jgi:hypothetical protein
MAIKAHYKNPRTVTQEDGTKKVLHYYRIVGMTPDEQELYKSDKGIYYCEDKDGTPMFSTNEARGTVLELKRASKPNPKTGTHSWYARRTFMEIYEDCAKLFPTLASTDKEEIKSMARDMYNAEEIVFVDVPAGDLGTF